MMGLVEMLERLSRSGSNVYDFVCQAPPSFHKGSTASPRGYRS